MDLILWRHAEAADANPGEGDMERHLTERGAKQARRVARWFLEHRPKDLRILVSPSARTRQTAEALALPFEIDPRIAPSGNAADLIAAAGWPDANRAVMLVGHQPTLGRIAALLLSGKEVNWGIKKGALWWFDTREGETVLRAVVGPDLL